jgi:hypothetical protein
MPTLDQVETLMNPAGWILSHEQDDTAKTRAGIIYTLHRDATQTVHTGTTAETLLRSYRIPGGLLNVHGLLRVYAIFSAGAADANVKTMNVRVNTAAVVGGTIINAVPLANVLTFESQMSAFARSTAQLVVGPAPAVGGSTSAMISAAIGLTADFFVNITAALAVATDTVRVEGVLIQACPT